MQRQRHLADLVEEQRAAMRGLEQPRLAAAPRTGERAVVIAEQLAFQQRLREGAAVHRHERERAARAQRVQALRDHLLAGAALAEYQHGRVRLRVAARQLAHALHRRGLAEHVVEPVARREALRVRLRTQRAVEPFDRARFLERQHAAGGRAARRERPAMHDVAHPAHGRERVAFGRAQRREFGRQLVERAADGGLRIDAEREREPRVDRLHAAQRVERHHAVAQMLEQVVEALAAQRLGVRGVRDFERGVHGRAHRGVRVEEHGAHAGARGQIGDEPGADHRVDAAIAQLVDARLGLLARLIRREHDVEPERGREAAQLGGRVAVVDERDRRGRIAPRARQRVQQVVACRADQHHRHLDVGLQVHAVRAGRHDRVGPLGAGARERGDRLVVAARDDAQVGALVVFVGEIAEQRAQPADADRPDARAKGRGGRRRHGRLRAGSAIGLACIIAMVFQIWNRVFP